MTAALTPMEVEILEECAGRRPAHSWGAAVGACLEGLKGHGYVARDGQITLAGRLYLDGAQAAPDPMPASQPERAPLSAGEDELREEIARALLARRGFGFYSDPMESGQDAYDITGEALEEASALIPIIKAREAGLKASAEAAEQLAYDLKYAAAGGEDAPLAANMVTVADVDRWRKGGEAREHAFEAEMAGKDAEIARLTAERDDWKGAYASEAAHRYSASEQIEALEARLRSGTGAVTLTDAMIEAAARKMRPWVWSLDPPDISSGQARHVSKIDARKVLEAAISAATLPSAPETLSPCKWGGGNDYLTCSTCQIEYDYRREDRPPCPRTLPPASPALDDLRELSEGASGRWTLADLRAANVARQAAWCPDQVPDLSFRAVELGGEVGEALNVAKKLERERLGWAGSRATIGHLAEELADVVICADLLALTAGIDLFAAVPAKFDATSKKVGLPHRLSTPAPSETGWRDISSAELKDLPVLVWSECFGRNVCYSYAQLSQYTHWHLLPSPPERPRS